MAAFNTVKQVVQGYMDKFPGVFKDSDKWMLQRHAVSWFSERDRFFVPARATVEIMLQSDRSAKLPDDFLDWLVVGQRQGDSVVNLCFNERVTRLPPVTESDAPDTTDTPVALLKVPYDGYLYGELYGYGGGEYPANEFVIDKDLGVLYTNSEVQPGPLYLQYIFNPDKPNIATPIAIDYMMPLEYWLEWQVNRRSPDRDALKRQYYQSLKGVTSGESAGNIDSWYNLFENRAYGQL